MPKISTKKINYEATFKELEVLVNSLEDTDLPLQDALKNFEKGIQLTNQCQQALTEAEQKVEILMQNQEQNSEQK
ncbi:MAG: exodeoxyribonuclease VII small subunit [Gammaproteobacteria bacterium]|nr:exodeoxyribonuclease VII small subunit [Gammaproteobacteria bacterium]